eukprot:scaffold159885_cov36-Prasinocladus_malaysianus.AAC.1
MAERAVAQEVFVGGVQAEGGVEVRQGLLHIARSVVDEPAGVEGQRGLGVQRDRLGEVRQRRLRVAQPVEQATAVVIRRRVLRLELRRSTTSKVLRVDTFAWTQQPAITIEAEVDSGMRLTNDDRISNALNCKILCIATTSFVQW